MGVDVGGWVGGIVGIGLKVEFSVGVKAGAFVDPGMLTITSLSLESGHPIANPIINITMVINNTTDPPDISHLEYRPNPLGGS